MSEKGTQEIVYEDDYLFVLNKPSGVVVNTSQNSQDLTTQEWISTNLNFEISKSFELRSGIVHRLDKETSGCLIVAKTKDIFEDLQKQFFERSVVKKYIALAHGHVKLQEGTINAPIGRNPKRRTRFGVVAGGREALTFYKTLDYYRKENEQFSLVELTPKTGRTHQIRVHLKHLGHPIVGDYLYAGRKTAKKDRKWCSRIFLHSSDISFLHPVLKKQINIHIPLPNELQEVISYITKVNETSSPQKS